jgi:hypothetical protein
VLARETVVRHLIAQASSAMEDACVADPTISPDEVMSAYVTLARNVMSVARQAGVDPRRLQGIAQQILLECFDAKHPQ